MFVRKWARGSRRLSKFEQEWDAAQKFFIDTKQLLTGCILLTWNATKNQLISYNISPILVLFERKAADKFFGWFWDSGQICWPSRNQLTNLSSVSEIWLWIRVWKRFFCPRLPTKLLAVSEPADKFVGGLMVKFISKLGYWVAFPFRQSRNGSSTFVSHYESFAFQALKICWLMLAWFPRSSKSETWMRTDPWSGSLKRSKAIRSRIPEMVNVLPDPVWPYARMEQTPPVGRNGIFYEWQI
jgi:hypothetical protein